MMKTFSVEEIIKFSQRVEEESYSFYKEAESKVKRDDVKALTKELQQAEMKHLNKLKGLLQETKLTREELDAKISLEHDPEEMIVSLKTIPPDAGQQEILETALTREKNTEGLYRRLLAFTDLSEDVTSTFQYLVKQEQGHVVTIEQKLKEL